MNAKDKAEIAAMIAAALAAVPTGAPASVKAESPFVGTARKGHAHEDTRAANLKARKTGFFCDGHTTHQPHGFAFHKDLCPSDGLPL